MIRRFEKVFAITRKPKSILKCEYVFVLSNYFFDQSIDSIKVLFHIKTILFSFWR
jgi:hypothetical protein